MAIKLTNEHLTRQLDIIPVEKLNLPIKIVGVGAIGSFACLQLVKMGFTDIEVWDYDTVSIENMSCQFYRHKDIGKTKVAALQELVEDFCGVTIATNNARFVAHSNLNGIVILAVDDMATRSALWQDIQRICFQVKAVIDPRMGAEDALLYVMNPWDEKDKQSYLKTLYSNAEAVQERCTAKATIYTANLLSGMVAKAVKNLACNEPYPRVTQWSIGQNQLTQWTKGVSHGES